MNWLACMFFGLLQVTVTIIVGIGKEERKRSFRSTWFSSSQETVYGIHASTEMVARWEDALPLFLQPRIFQHCSRVQATFSG